MSAEPFAYGHPERNDAYQHSVLGQQGVAGKIVTTKRKNIESNGRKNEVCLFGLGLDRESNPGFRAPTVATRGVAGVPYVNHIRDPLLLMACNLLNF
jgi:hypothetical protein